MDKSMPPNRWQTYQLFTSGHYIGWVAIPSITTFNVESELFAQDENEYATKIFYYNTKDMKVNKRIHANWKVTDYMDDEQVENLEAYCDADPNSIRLASIEDLDDVLAAGGKIFNGLLRIQEGYAEYKWEKVKDEIYGGYNLDGEYKLIMRC